MPPSTSISAGTLVRTTSPGEPRRSLPPLHPNRPVSSGTTRSVRGPSEPARVLGYYTISPGAIEFPRPADLTRRLGRHDVPAFRLGRLAVDRTAQGQGLGGELLLAAGERALAVAAEVGGVALAIDAKSSEAARWYARFGAQTLLDDPLKLILPLSVVADALASSGACP